MILTAGLAAQSAAQIPRPLRSGVVVPDEALYESLFYRVLFVEKIAREANNSGADGNSVLRRLQQSVGLSDEEMVILRAVAADWRSKHEEFVKEATPWAEAARGRRDAKGEPPPDLAPKLKALVEKRRQIVREGIGRLKSALGPSRFYSFDGRVRATSTLDGVMVSISPSEE